MQTRWLGFAKDKRGSVLLETALMITVLLVLAFGMIDFGRLMYTTNNLVSAAREGARVGAVQSTNISDSVKAIAKRRFNSFTFGGDNLADSNVVVIDSSAAAKTPPFVGDTIKYAFKWITPGACLLHFASCSTNRTTLHVFGAFRYEASP